MLFDLPLENIAQIVSYLTLPVDINNFRLVNSQAQMCASNFVTELDRYPKYGKEDLRRIYIKDSYIVLFHHLRRIKLPIMVLQRSNVDELMKMHLPRLEFPICSDPYLTIYNHASLPQYIIQLLDSSENPYENPEIQQFRWAVDNPNVVDNIPLHILEMATQYSHEVKIKSDQKNIYINNFINWIRIMLQTGPDHIKFKFDFYIGGSSNLLVIRAKDTLYFSGKVDISSLLSAIPLKKIIFHLDTVVPLNWSSLVQWKGTPYAGFDWISSTDTSFDQWLNILESATRFKFKLKSMFCIYDIIENIRNRLNRFLAESKSYPQIFDARIPVILTNIELLFQIFPNTQSLSLIHYISNPISDTLLKESFEKHPKLRTIRIYSHDVEYQDDHSVRFPFKDIKRKLFKRIFTSHKF